MTKADKSLRENKIWKDTYSIAEFIYSKLDDLANDFPDEKWTTVSKLRNAAHDSMFYVSLGVGNSIAEASSFDWNTARKNLFALQSMYIFAAKQKFLELDPQIVVKIDLLIQQIDTELKAAEKEAEENKKAEMKPWLERYRLWKEMQDKKNNV